MRDITRTRFAAVAGVAAGLLVSSASLAGQEPYVAGVGPDDAIDAFYLSDLLRQFLHTNNDWAYTKEGFKKKEPAVAQPEICDASGVFEQESSVEALAARYRGNANFLVPNKNAGSFEWTIVLPKKPSGNINIIIECGVLKPEAFTDRGFEAILVCAGEEGEVVAPGFCNRRLETPGRSPVQASALPTISAVASSYVNLPADPGPDVAARFLPFNLTAWRQPSTFIFNNPAPPPPPAEPVIITGASLTVLRGAPDNRVVLKACNAETFLAKFPVQGYTNGLEQTEADLEQGDKITVTMTIPRGHTMDIYCHQHSVLLSGTGIPETTLP